MNTNNFIIRKIKKDELSLIRDLPPPDWRIDPEKVFGQHYDQDYFHPVIAIIGSEIAGTGIAVVNDNAAWLGIIIVKENYRNKGLGTAITNHLIGYAKSRGIDSIILVASESGFPVYRKIGFEPDLNYLYFRRDTHTRIESVIENIAEISRKDHNWIFELDYNISGEKRENLLTNSLQGGFQYFHGIHKGYYLPDFGTGLIIADSEISGLELLKFRLSRDPSPICVPETNEAAISYLQSIGYYQFLKTPRMFLNKNIKWLSENVYSRGCGYLG
jgi:GNAT superfamily N-acetyltransferase